MKNSPKYLIVDGSNYLFTSYFGVPQLATYKNKKVNAIYGFFSILRRISTKVNPNQIFIIFDSQTGIQNKIEKRQEYKANRQLIDTGMYQQLPIIKEILKNCKIKWIEPPNNEADDIIGSLATKYSKENNVFISSNDLDFAQIINERITLVRNIKGKTIYITERKFIKQWGFLPQYYKDYLALKGDSTDNIDGIKGIGMKTAKDLIQKYNTVEGVVQNLHNLSNSLSSKIAQDIEKLRSNLQFLTIDTGLEVFNDYMCEDDNCFNKDALYLKKTNEHLDIIWEE